MKLLASFVIFVLAFIALSVHASSIFPDFLDKERYDEDAYERMLDQGDIELNRRRDDPETDESYWMDGEYDENHEESSSDGVKSSIVINGIDFDKLPPNYHKTITIGKGKNKVNVTIDKTTDPATGSVDISVVETANGHVINVLEKCSAKRPCAKGKYCLKTLVGSSCKECKSVDDTCDTNEECCGTSGALCVNSVCKTGYKKGDAGTICKSRDECNKDMCCARKFLHHRGECKRLAKKGEKCIVTGTTTTLILHGGECPCEKGLECSNGSWVESFFGGSLNMFFGGNTCRSPGTKKKKHGWGGWSIFDDNNDMDENFLEDFGP